MTVRGWQVDEFKTKVDGFPTPADDSESFEHASTGWIEGVTFADELNQNAGVALDRYANNQRHFDSPIMEYTVRFELGPEFYALTMTPEAAIAVGRMLVLAGTAAVRDEAANADFFAGGDGS